MSITKTLQDLGWDQKLVDAIEVVAKQVRSAEALTSEYDAFVSFNYFDVLGTSSLHIGDENPAGSHSFQIPS